MTVRAALAAGLVLLALGVTGCADRSTRSAQREPQPTVSTATPSSSPSAVPSPTRSVAPTARPDPPAKPKPTGTGLPPGLRRTTGVRAVALTFDDGPHPIWTPKVLDQLRAAQVKATFCLVGTQVRSHPGLVARIVREGHQLCNHSWQHDMNLGTQSAAVIRANLLRTNQAIRRAVPGARIPYYRQPGGKWTPEVVAVAKALGMQSLHWTVDPRDWAKPSAPTLSKRVIDQARPGAIVLLHDGGGDRSATLAACSNVIPALRKRYGIVRLK